MGPIRQVRKVVTISALLVILTLSLGGAVASKSNDTSATYENLKLFTEVLSIIQNQYVDEVPPKDLVYGAIKGTLRGLDPHSSFLDPEMYKEMQVETSGSFGGLGIEITLKDDVLTVVAPIEGTPAYRAGIHPGDRIVKIEGISTKDMQLTDAVKRMRGKPGTKVVISIVREGWTEPKDFDITREQIRVQSVKNKQLEPGIEYIRLRQFQEQTASDLETALEKYSKDNKIQGLILDLRNNPGGLLTSSVEVAEKFLDGGRLVVYTEGRVRNQNMRFQANAKHVYSDFPIVVLVNQGSASASEIVAGALQDLGSRRRARHAELRQGLGADHHPALRRLGPAPHDREVLHPEGPVDSRQGHHPRHHRRGAEGRGGRGDPRGAPARRRHSAGAAQEGRAAPAGARPAEGAEDPGQDPSRRARASSAG